MKSDAPVERDRTHQCGFVINDDGTIIVFLSGGDIVFQFANGKEMVHFADGTSAGWDSHSSMA